MTTFTGSKRRMLHLEEQFLEGTLEISQEGVATTMTENAGSGETDTPTRKRGPTNEPHRTALAVIDEYTPDKQKKKRKTGDSKGNQPATEEDRSQESQPSTGEILECGAHDRSMKEASKNTHLELLESICLMTNILKRLDDRIAMLQNEVQQIGSRLHEHIMMCPQDAELSDEMTLPPHALTVLVEPPPA